MINYDIALAFTPAMAAMFSHLLWQMLYEKQIINEFTPKPFGCDKCFAIWMSVPTLIIVPLPLIPLSLILSVFAAFYMSDRYFS